METLPILKQLLEAYSKEDAKLDTLIGHSIHRSVNDNLLQFSDNVYKDTDVTSGLSPVRISKSIENGDYTSMGAVDIGKGMYRCTNPKQEIAEVLKNILLQDSELKEFVNKLFSRVEAVNGYLNFYVSDFVIGNKVSSLLRNKTLDLLSYDERNTLVVVGTDPKGVRSVTKEKDRQPEPKEVNIEFVSVNPTGELHIGHARSAFYGDVLARLLSKAGLDITREYYINNAQASAQIKELGKTALGKGEQYNTAYIQQKIQEHKSELEKCKSAGEAGYVLAGYIQQDIKEFLEKKAHIRFDIWKEEQVLYEKKWFLGKNKVQKTLQALEKSEKVFKKDGALWFKWGEGEKEESVLVRSNGENTYFLADIAYHEDKVERGYSKMIDIWGRRPSRAH